jgi:uncharacterized membrane protein YqjE
MWHALLHLAAKRPALLAAHAAAYVDLVGAQGALVSSSWLRRLCLDIAAFVALLAAIVLAGVALLLWAALPDLRWPAGLVVVPLLPLGAAVACAWISRRPGAPATFEPVLQQLKADLQVLQAVATP